ncbi:prepilin peptidase [Nocardia sputorum]|uniref:prepilin peptidase n=1 Tax=Nocardia TaxID=1817 RepID=UPI0024919D87|nr:prepilin peptidase [Nocardia sputorum]BDT90301.1 prepilin peptidase [Nocardia sputorum]
MTPLACAVLAVWCVALTVFDLRERRLPNELTGSGALTVLGYGLYTGQFAAALLGAVLLSAPYLLVHLAAPAALGAGDVKLAAMLGGAAALGGARPWVWAALGAPALTACVALGALACRGGFGSHAADPGAGAVTVPHGPAMCLATLLALFSSTLDST